MKYEITSLNTKKALAASLKELMRTKPFSKITVSEIIRDCGVNRKTFYYHFEDIYALLQWIFDQEAIQEFHQYDLVNDFDSALRFVLNYVEENDHILNCAYDSIGRDQMKRFFFSEFIKATSILLSKAEEYNGISVNPDYREFWCTFYAEAIASILIEWLQNHDHLDKENFIEYLTKTVKTALINIK